MTAYLQLIQLLKNNDIPFEEFDHQPVRSCHDAVRVRQIMGLEPGTLPIVTTFIEKDKTEKVFMLVLPGDKPFNSKKLRQIYNLKDVRFAPEDIVFKITDGVESACLHAFGNIFNLKIICDEKVLENEEMIFNAGERTKSVKIKTEHWVKLTNPEVLSIV